MTKRENICMYKIKWEYILEEEVEKKTVSATVTMYEEEILKRIK